MTTYPMATAHFPIERRPKPHGDDSTESGGDELENTGKRNTTAVSDGRVVWMRHGEQLVDGDGHSLGGEEGEEFIQSQNAYRV